MHWLIDAGHGGVMFGHYLTRGKRSPGKMTETDMGIFEGQFNREIAIRLADSAGLLTIGPCDTPLRTRVKAINELCLRYDDIALISIHANAAARSKWSGARGYRVFHSRNAGGHSKRLAQIIDESIFRAKIGIPRREIAARNLYILRKTKCPAVLIECGFMTNQIDAAVLKQPVYQRAYATAILNAMEVFEQ